MKEEAELLRSEWEMGDLNLNFGTFWIRSSKLHSDSPSASWQP
jgi:hypothetical protein